MDMTLSAEHAAVRALAAEFVDREVMPRASEWDRDEYPVGKYLLDARVTTLYEGTSQIQQLVIGRALTGVNAFN